jgi:hypothetical protein
MEALGQGDWTRVAAVAHRVVGRRLASIPVSVDELHWDGYFVVDESTRELVGSCAFKTPPTEDGTVEIAYFTYPGSRGVVTRRLWQPSSSSWRAGRRWSGGLSPTRWPIRVHPLGCWRRWE